MYDPSALPQLIPLSTIQTIVSAGAAGWVDTDLTGEAQILTYTGILIIACGAGAQASGARGPGETTAPLIPGNWIATLLVNCINGHVEYYRNAAVDAYYEVLGKVQ